nr:hypothetical protein [Bradyrhizobium arachidis]
MEAFTPRCRILRAAGEEILIRLVEIAQCLLLAGLRYGRNPVKGGTKRGQLPALAGVANSASGPGRVLPPEVFPLVKRGVVDRTARACELPKQHFLFGSRIELIFEAAADHIDDMALV